MEGRHAFPDTKAERSKCADELERTRLPEAGHENSRHPLFNEGAVGLKRSLFWPPSTVEVTLGLPGPSDDPQDFLRAITQLTAFCATRRQCISALLHTLGQKWTLLTIHSLGISKNMF